eukprot:1968153-Rhodomonas_salina.4
MQAGRTDPAWVLALAEDCELLSRLEHPRVSMPLAANDMQQRQVECLCVSRHFNVCGLCFLTQRVERLGQKCQGAWSTLNESS